MDNAKAKPGRLHRRLSAAISEMKQVASGARAPSRAWKIVPDGEGGFVRRQIAAKKAVPLKPGAALALAARMKLKLSQHDFAALIGVADGTLKGWEQGRREPNRAARVLLAVAARAPEAVLAAAKAA